MARITGFAGGAFINVEQDAADDTTPDAFSFVDQSGVALSSTITSAAITVTGIDPAAAITVTGGEYDINGSGTFTSDAGTVNSGDTVRARGTSSGDYSTATNVTVTIGGVSDTFTFTTEDAPADPVPVFIGPSVGTLVLLVDAAMASIDLSARFTHDTDSLTYELTGTLPAGLSFTTDTLAGTPSETGTFGGLVVTATDENTDTAVSDTFTIRVVAEFANIRPYRGLRGKGIRNYW